MEVMMGSDWDNEIDWDGPSVVVPLPLPDAFAEKAFRLSPTVVDGRVPLVAVCPADGGCWLVDYVAPTNAISETLDVEFSEGASEITIRFGRGALGCVERMSEFDGW